MTAYNIQFTTAAALPIKIGETPDGTLGRVVTPDRHIGKLAMKLDAGRVACISDGAVWTKFGNVRVEPLVPGESVIVTREYDDPFYEDDDFDSLF